MKGKKWLKLAKMIKMVKIDKKILKKFKHNKTENQVENKKFFYSLIYNYNLD